MILSARLIKHMRTTRYCDHCERPIRRGERALRLYGMADAGDKPSTLYFHPHYEEVDEIRACAPDHPKVRDALHPAKRTHGDHPALYTTIERAEVKRRADVATEQYEPEEIS